ncbi:6,7-dimethyl-8-ribityllumazine synthase [Phenylobacterium deserti]|uniref:6,7-dimethyl-8-ribityllumazine synthase n=1 Tax=Phenylobacterium deserti TaxID=1914756 RepID=A0A328ABC1_9CAUL|nr:6,7-dimethyl-8-ribityllumazine synthase [Phenylobacterium deserti]RAK52022.1 6,7-dimethyl-8-ribityllumazine synthase [Phenylobacterium deserti]
MSEDKVRILIVEARFYSDLADELLKGASDALTAFGAEFDVVTVPGALEIPGAIAFAAEGGHGPGRSYDGYVALGTVIRGETYHFEIVSNESARGIMDLTVRKQLAIGNGVLTTEDEEQAWARARVNEGDKGGGAARAALTMVELKQQLMGAGR